jgi:hypothetical protein
MTYDLKTYTDTYRAARDYAMKRWGLTVTEFQDECFPLSEHYMEKGETVPEAWCSAAQEVVSERLERENEQGVT